MRTGLAGILAAVVLAALAMPARALADESLSATGSITYTWQGDPARGCAAAGLCGVRGELIVQPQGGSSASSFRGTVEVPIFSPTLTVRAIGPGGVCVDVPEGLYGSQLSLSRRRRGRLVGRIEPPFSSSRCAGPTSQDLARLTFPVRRFGARRPSYDLRVSRRFEAGPFTGTFVSTLVLRPSTGGGGSSSRSFPGPPAPPRHKILLERVTLRYRVASLPSALDAAFSGEPDPFCAAFAACGATGTLALAFPRFARTFVVRASRVVSKRVSTGRAMADLRRGVLSLEGGSPIPFGAGTGTGTGTGARTRVSETFRAGDGSSCQAVSTSRQAQLFLNPGPFGGPHPAVQVVVNDPNDAGLIRTYCPGPTDTDLFGRNDTVLATTKVGLAQLLRRRSVFTLSRPGGFAGPGYVGTRGGALRFSLTLQHVRAGTVQEVAP